MKTKTVRNIVIAVAVIGLMGWRLASNKNEMEEKAERSFEINPTVLVRVDSVKYFNADNTIMVDGRINACNEVTLYSKIQGIVLKKYKKAGDRVGKGTVIAQVENAVIREMLGLAELNLANAAKDVERYKKLAESGAVTQREYESILITSREAQRAVVELKEQLANTTLTSPVNGILETDYFEEGTLLSPGTQVADFVDPSGLKAIVSITESEMYRVRKGDKTVLTTDILPNHTFDGIVDVISSKGNNRLSYQVEILITDKRADLLKSGMYVSTQIIPEQISGNKKMVINRKAIIESLQTPEVYVIKDNKAYKQKITIGKVADNFVEVTAGLSLNDKVVVSGQINLLDGRDIQIIK
ncbi:MAG: efflux RND transporter periplasmic adaptor subunit [Candidatus Symbiothrix sp.]|jgi:RND family efflux transporter MFP subunit|nr:efflux RND transporter periplasmic adaptor subunit [Candidatus Symbiothrix sp.]